MTEQAENESTKEEKVVDVVGEKTEETKSKKKEAPEPPTDVMMKVAARAGEKNKKLLKKFSNEEIQRLMQRRENGELLNKDENSALTISYRRIKRRVKELEDEGDRSKIYAFPSMKSEGGWYKMIDISALFTSYVVMPAISRRAKVMTDTDKFRKADYVIGFQRIEEFREEFEKAFGVTTVVATDGVYIFTLPKPLTDQEVGNLIRLEEKRRDKTRNVLKPVAMNPSAYTKILTVDRSLTPKLNGMQKHFYYQVGEPMAKELMALMATYFDFADGIENEEEAGKKLMHSCNVLLSGLSTASENRIWPAESCAELGEIINDLKETIKKDFLIK